MNKTLYIREEDAGVWERARDLAGDKLSPIIVSSLRQFIASKEAEAKSFERIEVEYSDEELNGLSRRKAFYGRWIFPPEKPEYVANELGDEVKNWTVALTAKGAIVILCWREGTNKFGDNWQSWKRFRVYESFEDAAADSQDNWAARRARDKIGIPVEELDI